VAQSLGGFFVARGGEVRGLAEVAVNLGDFCGSRRPDLGKIKNRRIGQSFGVHIEEKRARRAVVPEGGRRDDPGFLTDPGEPAKPDHHAHVAAIFQINNRVLDDADKLPLVVPHILPDHLVPLAGVHLGIRADSPKQWQNNTERKADNFAEARRHGQAPRGGTRIDHRNKLYANSRAQAIRFFCIFLFVLWIAGCPVNRWERKGRHF